MEYIIPIFIYTLTAGIMAAIGIVQLKSKKPVGFYSGEKSPTESELTDVRAWNIRHGLMWLIYGIIIFVTGIGAFFVYSSALTILLTLGGSLVPNPLMVMYHHKLEKKYKIK